MFLQIGKVTRSCLHKEYSGIEVDHFSYAMKVCPGVIGLPACLQLNLKDYPKCFYKIEKPAQTENWIFAIRPFCNKIYMKNLSVQKLISNLKVEVKYCIKLSLTVFDWLVCYININIWLIYHYRLSKLLMVEC